MKEIFINPWPWYVTGPMLGASIPLLLFFGNKMLGMSSSMQHICAALIPTKATYFKYDWRSGIWNVIVASGVAVAGIFTRLFMYNPNPVKIAESTKSDLQKLGITDFNGLMPMEIFGNEQIISLNGVLFMLLGGFLVGFGARYSGGCTSGHGFMGLSQASISSLAAIMSFFAAGVLMTKVVLPFIL